HGIYPSLLRDVTISRPDQAWCSGSTVIRLRGGFIYLVAVMDWLMRYVLAWEVLWSVTTAVALIAFVSVWALITGVLRIVLAIRLRREIRGEWLLALNGAASILLAALIMGAPLPATFVLIWALGIYAIVMGALMI